MKLRKYLYLTPAEAIEYGFTHEGTLFGMPAYLKDNGDGEIIGCPKVPVLQFVAMILDSLLELFSMFLPVGAEIETPHRFDAKLEPQA